MVWQALVPGQPGERSGLLRKDWTWVQGVNPHSPESREENAGVTCWRGAGAQALKNTGRAIRCFPELLPIFPPSVKLGRFYIFFRK